MNMFPFRFICSFLVHLCIYVVCVCLWDWDILLNKYIIK